jgi:hypothetical protein
MDLLTTFAQKYRLRMKRDECGELIIPGRLGESQIYEHSPVRLGVVIMPGKPFVWANARKKLLAAGCQVVQNGDWEGTALFDPQNTTQAQLAIKLIKVRRKKVLSTRQLETARRNFGLSAAGRVDRAVRALE